MKKDICLCIIKEKGINIRVHSIGIRNKDGKYYSEEQCVYFDLSENTNLFDYIELTWLEFRIFISSENIICVNLIIEVLNDLYSNSWVTDTSKEEVSIKIKYWKDIKKELEKLKLII